MNRGRGEKVMEGKYGKKKAEGKRRIRKKSSISKGC